MSVGSDVDDLRAHPPQEQVSQCERPQEICADCRLEAVDGVGAMLGESPGIVDQNVHVFVKQGGKRPDRRQVGEIKFDDRRGAADLSGALLDWSDASIGDVVTAVQGSDLVVVASPTYKATYTGLLKLFLDRIAGGALAGVTAVPVMLGGHWRHALAADLLLKPVLVELGATCPTRGLFLLESEYAGGETLDGWLELARPQLATSVEA